MSKKKNDDKCTPPPCKVWKEYTVVTGQNEQVSEQYSSLPIEENQVSKDLSRSPHGQGIPAESKGRTKVKEDRPEPKSQTQIPPPTFQAESCDVIANIVCSPSRPCDILDPAYTDPLDYVNPCNSPRKLGIPAMDSGFWLSNSTGRPVCSASQNYASWPNQQQQQTSHTNASSPSQPNEASRTNASSPSQANEASHVSAHSAGQQKGDLSEVPGPTEDDFTKFTKDANEDEAGKGKSKLHGSEGGSHVSEEVRIVVNEETIVLGPMPQPQKAHVNIPKQTSTPDKSGVVPNNLSNQPSDKPSSTCFDPVDSSMMQGAPSVEPCEPLKNKTGQSTTSGDKVSSSPRKKRPKTTSVDSPMSTNQVGEPTMSRPVNCRFHPSPEVFTGNTSFREDGPAIYGRETNDALRSIFKPRKTNSMAVISGRKEKMIMEEQERQLLTEREEKAAGDARRFMNFAGSCFGAGESNPLLQTSGGSSYPMSGIGGKARLSYSGKNTYESVERQEVLSEIVKSGAKNMGAEVPIIRRLNPVPARSKLENWSHLDEGRSWEQQLDNPVPGRTKMENWSRIDENRSWEEQQLDAPEGEDETESCSFADYMPWFSSPVEYRKTPSVGRTDRPPEQTKELSAYRSFSSPKKSPSNLYQRPWLSPEVQQTKLYSRPPQTKPYSRPQETKPFSRPEFDQVLKEFVENIGLGADMLSQRLREIKCPNIAEDIGEEGSGRKPKWMTKLGRFFGVKTKATTAVQTEGDAKAEPSRQPPGRRWNVEHTSRSAGGYAQAEYSDVSLRHSEEDASMDESVESFGKAKSMGESVDSKSELSSKSVKRYAKAEPTSQSGGGYAMARHSGYPVSDYGKAERSRESMALTPSSSASPELGVVYQGPSHKRSSIESSRLASRKSSKSSHKSPRGARSLHSNWKPSKRPLTQDDDGSFASSCSRCEELSTHLENRFHTKPRGDDRTKTASKKSDKSSKGKQRLERNGRQKEVRKGPPKLYSFKEDEQTDSGDYASRDERNGRIIAPPSPPPTSTRCATKTCEATGNQFSNLDKSLMEGSRKAFCVPCYSPRFSQATGTQVQNGQNSSPNQRNIPVSVPVCSPNCAFNTRGTAGTMNCLDDGPGWKPDQQHCRGVSAQPSATEAGTSRDYTPVPVPSVVVTRPSPPSPPRVPPENTKPRQSSSSRCYLRLPNDPPPDIRQQKVNRSSKEKRMERSTADHGPKGKGKGKEMSGFSLKSDETEEVWRIVDYSSGKTWEVWPPPPTVDDSSKRNRSSRRVVAPADSQVYSAKMDKTGKILRQVADESTKLKRRSLVGTSRGSQSYPRNADEAEAIRQIAGGSDIEKRYWQTEGSDISRRYSAIADDREEIWHDADDSSNGRGHLRLGAPRSSPFAAVNTDESGEIRPQSFHAGKSQTQFLPHATRIELPYYYRAESSELFENAAENYKTNSKHGLSSRFSSANADRTPTKWGNSLPHSSLADRKNVMNHDLSRSSVGNYKLVKPEHYNATQAAGGKQQFRQNEESGQTGGTPRRESGGRNRSLNSGSFSVFSKTYLLRGKDSDASSRPNDLQVGDKDGEEVDGEEISKKSGAASAAPATYYQQQSVKGTIPMQLNVAGTNSAATKSRFSTASFSNRTSGKEAQFDSSDFPRSGASPSPTFQQHGGVSMRSFQPSWRINRSSGERKFPSSASFSTAEPL